jgi:hypothetical protein
VSSQRANPKPPPKTRRYVTPTQGAQYSNDALHGCLVDHWNGDVINAQTATQALKLLFVIQTWVMAISREAEPVSEAVERVFNVLLLILEAPLSSAPAAKQAQVWPETQRCISLRLWLPTWVAVFTHRCRRMLRQRREAQLRLIRAWPSRPLPSQSELPWAKVLMVNDHEVIIHVTRALSHGQCAAGLGLTYVLFRCRISAEEKD